MNKDNIITFIIITIIIIIIIIIIIVNDRLRCTSASLILQSSLKILETYPSLSCCNVEILQYMATTTTLGQQMDGEKTNRKRKFPNCFKVLSEILEIIGHYFGLLGLPISLIFSMEVDVLNFFIFHPNLCTSLKILINTS